MDIMRELLHLHGLQQTKIREVFNMHKIRLSNGTELNIESVDDGYIAVVTEDLTIIDSYVKSLTKENLSKVEVLEESGNVTLTLKDKYLTGFDGTQVVGEEGNYIVCFRLNDVYTLEERIAMLEAENAALKESQEIQDEAIVELAGIIAE